MSGSLSSLLGKLHIGGTYPVSFCLIFCDNHGDDNRSLNFDPCMLHVSYPSQLPSHTYMYRCLCVHCDYLSVSCIFCTATLMIMCSSLQDGESPLMFASQNGHIEIVRILLSASAKVDLQNEVTYCMALW